MNVVTGKTQFTDAEMAALRDQVKRTATEQDISIAEVGRQADVPSSTLSQFLSDTYPSEKGRQEVSAKLTRWLRSIEVAAAVRRQMPERPAYRPMAGSAQIMGILRYARETGRLVMIAGSPGVSKTATARQFREDTPRTWYAPMDSTTNGAPTMLLEVLAAMGEPEAKGPPQMLMRRICAKAGEAKGLLIIDEGQHLTPPALEALRAINDRVGVGIAIMGNEAAYSQVGPTGVKAAFAQVSSRFARRIFILEPLAEDAAQLAQAWAETNGEVATKPIVAFCQKIAAKPGGLRNIEMAFEGALIAARGADEPLDLSHLQGAFSAISGGVQIL